MSTLLQLNCIFYLVDVIDNVMRQECKKRGIKNLKALFQLKIPCRRKLTHLNQQGKKKFAL